MNAAQSERLDTFPRLLARNARQHGAEIAYREKRLGIWHETSWAEYQARVQGIALGLHSLGVQRGDAVALIGDNRPDWLCGEVAAHALGAMSLGIYRDALHDEVAYLLEHAAAPVVLAEDEEQVDKLLELGERAASLRHIVYSDPRGMGKYCDARLLSMEELLRRGEAQRREDAGAYARMLDAASGEEVAILCTTSGTTSHPKLAMLQSGRFIKHCAAYLRYDPRGAGDEYVSMQPLPWIIEQVYAVCLPLLCRMRVNFAEEPETAMHDMRELGPSLLLLAPRAWEQLAAQVRARMMDASRLKQWIFELGLRLGMRTIVHGRVSRAAHWLLFRALKDRLGLSRLASATTGGAPLGPETFRFFLAMGVPLRQLYGQTELIGPYTLHPPGQVDFDSVGVAFEEVEVQIRNPDEQGVGEIAARSRNRFAGYYKNETATKEALDGEWMLTGDAGYFKPENGHLVVIDRVKDLAETSGGVRFSPQFIENKLKFCPYIAEAVVLGDGRPEIAALICIRFSIVSKWAEKNRIAFTTYSDLTARPEICEIIRREVAAVNQTLPPAQRIGRFLLLYKELDADDGELTRTRKVRRGKINERYDDIIDGLYSGAQTVAVDAEIAFQDGSTQRIRTRLQVMAMQPPQPVESAQSPQNGVPA